MEIKLLNKQGQEFVYSDIQQITIDEIDKSYRIKAVGGLQISKNSEYDKSINIIVINDFIVLR